MTYNDIEQSVALGEPIELYDMLEPNGTHHRINTSSETVIYLTNDYEPGITDRTEMEIGENGEVNALQVKLHRGNALANNFISAPIEGEVALTIYRQHAGFTVTFWQGFLSAVIFDGDGIPTLRFEPRTSDMPSIGQRRRNQRLCDYALYKTGCRVNEEAYRVDGTITNISGLVITSPAFATKANGWFVGGEIVVGLTRRLIKAHATNTITITPRAGGELAIGEIFRAYAGCDHTPATCKTKFDNKLNYGGNEFLPVMNPFEGSVLYG